VGEAATTDGPIRISRLALLRLTSTGDNPVHEMEKGHSMFVGNGI
jgi:hypothetical protein